MSVASQNLFALLGNTDDSDDTPKAPVKTVEKQTTRTTKRNVAPEAPARLPAGGQPSRRGGGSGNDAAFRDRNAGSANNRTRGTDESAKGGPRGGAGARGRGGRGGRFPREQNDRHSRGPAGGVSEKQVAHGWGATEGNAELKDEQAGEAIAQSEQKEAEGEDGDAKPEEPEEKHFSYEEYLAQQAEKKLALGDKLNLRSANEGNNQKWGQTQELHREEQEFMPATAGKSQREKKQKQKQVLDIDQRYVEPERPARGGGAPRGGGRGERGGPRGGPRGGGRGGERGGAPRGGNNAPRGGGRGGAAPINTKDESAFPSLGGK